MVVERYYDISEGNVDANLLDVCEALGDFGVSSLVPNRLACRLHGVPRHE